MLGFAQIATWVLGLIIVVMFGLSFTKLDKSKVFYFIVAIVCFLIATAYGARLILHDTSTMWPYASVIIWLLYGTLALVKTKLEWDDEKEREEESRRIIIPTREQITAINAEPINIKLGKGTTDWFTDNPN